MTPRNVKTLLSSFIGLLSATILLSSVSAAACYRIEVVAEGLDHPWGLALLPDGDMIFTERGGRLRIIRNGTLDPEPIAGVPPVQLKKQTGLYDVVAHPSFAENSLIYLSFVHKEDDENRIRIVRAKLGTDRLLDLEIVFDADPPTPTPTQLGGRMTFLDDGTLMLSTGDAYDYREDAQRLNNHWGKILRMNDDGSIPTDNPFVGQSGARGEIWTIGHRHPQGITQDPKSKEIYSTEHGAWGGDELNHIVKGNNYGWPIISYGRDYNGSSITPYTEYPGLEQPLTYWAPSIATSSVAVYRGEAFPEWDGDILVTALGWEHGRHVRRVELENGKVTAQEKLFTELNQRLRHVVVGPEGEIYLLAEGTEKVEGEINTDGLIYRVVPD